MTTLEAVAFGAMLAWTPSLIILAASLWDIREIEGMDSRQFAEFRSSEVYGSRRARVTILSRYDLSVGARHGERVEVSLGVDDGR
jgi:hypothetical protein